MTVKNTVSTLTRTGIATTISVVRHPVGTASMAVGLARGAVQASADLVRQHVGSSPRGGAVEDVVEQPQRVEETTTEPVAEQAEPVARTEPVQPVEKADPRDNIPGPDLAAFAPPAPEDLPEPIVIEADPAHDVGESFHTEPKAASRESAHGRPAP